MGCDPVVYRARVGTWTARTRWLAQGSNSDVQVRSYFVDTCLCPAVLAVLLVTGRVEQNPGRGVEGETYIQIMFSWCDRSLNSGTQCDTCGRWFHNSCGNVKTQWADSGK